MFEFLKFKKKPPVKKGTWTNIGLFYIDFQECLCIFKCSECGENSVFEIGHPDRKCLKCGSPMLR